jgi:excisionase family DNA binding protein
VIAKDWLTTTEIAELVGYSDRWVRRQIELGRLKAIAFDAGARRTLRVHRRDFAEFQGRYLHAATELPPRSER